jgi:hypothetical protein
MLQHGHCPCADGQTLFDQNLELNIHFYRNEWTDGALLETQFRQEFLQALALDLSRLNDCGSRLA